MRLPAVRAVADGAVAGPALGLRELERRRLAGQAPGAGGVDRVREVAALRADVVVDDVAELKPGRDGVVGEPGAEARASPLGVHPRLEAADGPEPDHARLLADSDAGEPHDGGVRRVGRAAF